MYSLVRSTEYTITYYYIMENPSTKNVFLLHTPFFPLTLRLSGDGVTQAILNNPIKPRD